MPDNPFIEDRLFENACATLVVCHEAIEEALDDNKTLVTFIDELGTEEERRSFKWMYELCQQFTELYDKLRFEKR